MSNSDRSLAVIKLFSIDKPVWTADEIASTLSVSISTAYRYLSALEEVGLVATSRPGQYALGPAIVQLDRQIQLTDPLLKAARPVMNDLSTYAPPGSAVLLCRPMGEYVLCLDQVLTRGPQPPVSYERGRPMPLLFGATSKILLAHLPPRAIKAVFKGYEVEIATAGLGTTLNEFRATLASWRKAGHVITFSEVDAGRIGIAAPILNEERIGVGSLSYVVPDTTEERVLSRLSSLVVSGAREIEAALAGEGTSVSITEQHTDAA